MKITSILSDELIQELFDAYVEVHNVKKALKGEDGKVGDGEFKFEDRFIQAGSDHLLRVALIIGDETIFVEEMVLEKAPMLSAQERRALVGLAKTKLVKQIFVFGLNVASENKQSGSPPQYR